MKLPLLVYIICGIAIVAGLYLYRPTDLFFLADDFLHIPESTDSFLLQRNSLRPVGNFSLYLDGIWSGKSPLGYHRTNLLLHFINSLLVFFLARQFVIRYEQSPSNQLPLLSSVLFFIYPFHSESIFWIIGRSASLGALFFLLAFILYFRNRHSLLSGLAILLCFELALLSYESSWIFPIIITLIAIIEKRKSSLQRSYFLVSAIWLLFIVHLFLRFKTTGQIFHQYDTSAFLRFDIPGLLMNGCRLIARSFLPPFVNEYYLLGAFTIILFVLLGSIISLVKKRKLGTLFLVLIATLLLSYLPYLSLGIDTHGTEGERYLYLPSVFIAILLIYLLKLILKDGWFFVSFFVLYLFSLYYLGQSRKYYTKAGTVVKTTLTEINKLSNKRNIYIENLPQYNKGAVIFRLGLEEGVKWLLPASNRNIIVVSIDDSDLKIRKHHHKNFIVNYQESTIPFLLRQILVKDPSFKKTYMSKDTVGLYFHPQTDAWLRYTDTSLIIIK